MSSVGDNGGAAAEVTGESFADRQTDVRGESKPENPLSFFCSGGPLIRRSSVPKMPPFGEIETRRRRLPPERTVE